MCSVTSPFYWLPRFTSPGGTPAWPDDRGIIFSMHGVTLQLPRSAFLAAQAILGCMIAQNLTGSILTTLAVNWPIVLAILLVTLLSSAIVGWLLVRYSSLPGNTGAWGSSPGGAAAMVAMAQDYGADIRLVAFMQYLRVLFVAGAAVLVTRMMLGDNAEAVNQQIVWFPPVSINLLLTILLAVVAGTAGCLLRLPSGTMLIPMLAGAVLQSGQLITIELPEWLLAMAYMAIGWRIGLGFDKQILIGIAPATANPAVDFCSAGYLCGHGVGADPVYAY